MLSEQEEGGSEFTLYLPSTLGENPLLYRYQLRVVTEDGEMFREEQWHDGRELMQFIGAAQLRPLFPSGEQGQ
ncbi:hypothetical protein [Desulfolithobacter sp.]